jgi:hypothetical protein
MTVAAIGHTVLLGQMLDLHPNLVEEHDHRDMPSQLDQTQNANKDANHGQGIAVHASENTRPEAANRGASTTCNGTLSNPHGGFYLVMRYET